eukprot:6061422-Amphidinium_carterae.2
MDMQEVELALLLDPKHCQMRRCQMKHAEKLTWTGQMPADEPKQLQMHEPKCLRRAETAAALRPTKAETTKAPNDTTKPPHILRTKARAAEGPTLN